MTKIAIQPNASGSGTFTLTAPDSNTNRTFTLPDATGEVYTSGNILGTVSEDGGVPTGAIIERGSNANGEFVRFADGTQICTLSYTNNRTTTGVISASITLPAEFIDNDWAMGSTGNTGRPDIQSGLTHTGKSTTGFVAHDDRSNTTTNTFFMAIVGRWF